MQQIRYSKAKPKNPLAGAINIAIQDAERYGTPLIIKGKDGKIREVSPSQMKRIVTAKKK
jgi:hypothetical protein